MVVLIGSCVCDKAWEVAGVLCLMCIVGYGSLQTEGRELRRNHGGTLLTLLLLSGLLFFSTHSELDPPTSLINQDIALHSLVPTGSPPPVTPGPGDLISSSSLYGYPHTPRTHTCKHLRAHIQTRLQKYIHTLIYTH